MENHFDGARELPGHGAFEARGKLFERGSLGADQRSRLERVVFLNGTHWFLMVTKRQGTEGLATQGPGKPEALVGLSLPMTWGMT